MQCETHNIQRILFMSPGMTENNLSVFSGKRQCFALRITFHQTVFLASTHPYHSIIWKSYLFIGTKDKIRIEIEVCVFVFVCVYNIMHNPSILCVCGLDEFCNKSEIGFERRCLSLFPRFRWHCIKFPCENSMASF